MTKNNNGGKSGNSIFLKIIISIIAILIVAIAVIYFNPDKNKDKQSEIIKPSMQKNTTLKKEIQPEPALKVEPKPAIDYSELEKNEELKKTMDKRKEKFDLKNSIDMIVERDETFKINGIEISMDKILKKAALKRGDVVEENIENNFEDKDQNQYGVYVVKPGDNIWNIHFNILKEYYSLKNISMDMDSDEPDTKGFSSGVGKILKFSETVVIIYNLEQDTIDSNINIIEPLTKIIIYNMSEIFSLLNEIDYENIEKLQFDGKTIWISTDK